MGKSEDVIENFNRVIRKNPYVDLAWYYIGEAFKNLGKNELAEEAFGKIINKNKITASRTSTRVDHFPIGIYAMFQLSRIYYETNRFDLAVKN